MAGHGTTHDTKREVDELREFARQPDGSFKITGDMLIADVIAGFPQTAGIMLGFGLHCVGCYANVFDTVEGGARGHGMSDEEIAQMVDEINVIVNKRIDTIELTRKAVAKIKELRKEEDGKTDWPLRITVNAVKDEATDEIERFAYEMDFGQREPGDLLLDFDGLGVIIDETSFPLLKGSSIDYVESMAGSGFKITNPNAPDRDGER